MACTSILRRYVDYCTHHDVFVRGCPFDDAPFLHVSRVDRLQINKHNIYWFILLGSASCRALFAVFQQQTGFFANFTHFIGNAEKNMKALFYVCHMLKLA